MGKHEYNQSIQRADKAFTDWCNVNDVPLHGIQHVTTWEDWDDGIGVYLFLKCIAQVEALSENQTAEMKDRYLSYLEEFDYPFDKFPEVVFEFDSDENVRKNYGGSYFNRLR